MCFFMVDDIGFMFFGRWVSEISTPCSGIVAFTSNDIKVGSNLEVDGSPWRVLGVNCVSHHATFCVYSFISFSCLREHSFSMSTAA